MATALQKQVSFNFYGSILCFISIIFNEDTFVVFSGIIVPGGFGKRGLQGKIEACRWCRTNNKPFLGICLGLQAAVIELARNVLNLQSANSTEIDPNTSTPVVIDMPEHNQGIMGGTMRLGKRQTRFCNNNSVLSK